MPVITYRLNMDTEKLRRILDLEAKIKYHDYMYFNQDMPVISDSEYDDLVREYKDLLEQVPSYKSTVRVGFVEVDSKLGTVEISEPMISISKKKTPKDFNVWIARHVNANEVYEDKLDGIAIRLVYTRGVLTAAHTRGRGDIGEDVTHRLGLITNIPTEIEGYKEFEKRTITGECFCTFADFDEYLKRHGLDPKETDTRSLVSGLLRRQTPGDREDLPIKFKAYNADLETRKQFDTYAELADHFISIGFEIPKQFNKEEVNAMLELASKPIGEYPIDGIVVKLGNLREWEKEQTGEYYTYATCYKFPTLSYETKVTGIDWSLSNEGQLIGTLMYDPVEYDGTKLTRCKLDYAGSYFEKGLRIGSVIRITKANEIIPNLVGLVEPGDGERLSYPENCPFCNHPIEYYQLYGTAYCKNENCEGQLIKQLTRLVSKQGLNVKGLGDERVQALVDNGFLSEPADLFKLTESDFINSGIGKGDAENILNQISRASDRDIIHWLYGLAIPGLGLVRAADISNLAATNGLNDQLQLHDAYSFVTVLSDAKYMSDLFGLDGLPMVSHVKKNADEIQRFLSYYNFNRQSVVKEVGIPIAITGTWAALPRSMMEEGLAAAGYTVTDSVTKSSKCLLIGDKPGASKLEKANRYGIPKYSITQVHTMTGIIALIESKPQ
ncbi:putative DNA ligase (NAD+) [Serratia phage vB_SmaM-Sureiya]|nr:putative DNA ligase (NAD+) [Serratia phage vB_SmaM-Sureiya]